MPLPHIVSILDWIGGHGTRAIAASLFLGMAAPPLSALMKPLLPSAVFVLLTLAFLRVDGAAVLARLRRPWLALAVTGWVLVLVPLAVGAAVNAVGLPARAPEVAMALIVMAVAPPIMSSPAFTAMLGLDGALSLGILLVCMVATPLTAPLIADLVLGPLLPLSGSALALRLGLLLAGSYLLARLVRWWAGSARVAAAARRIDGLTVVVLFIFAVAIMDGVALRLWREPALVLGLTALAFALAALLAVVSGFVFSAAGRDPAMTIGLVNGGRNMGLMIAAMAGSIPDTAWVFFAVAQFPIYLFPQLAKPIVARLRIPAAG